jgi:hypothetical protein
MENAVVASALDGLAIPLEVVAGVGVVLAEIGLNVWRRRRRFKRRHPDIVAEWRTVSRETYKSLRATVRGRRPIEPQEAALVIAWVDLVDKLRRARRLKKRKSPARLLTQHVVVLLVAAYAIGSGDDFLGAVGVGLLGYYGVLLPLMLVCHIRAREWNLHWPNRSVDARAEAVRVLAQRDTADHLSAALARVGV